MIAWAPICYIANPGWVGRARLSGTNGKGATVRNSFGDSQEYLSKDVGDNLGIQPIFV